MGEMVSVLDKSVQPDMARSEWKHCEVVYLLGVLGAAAVALRRAVLVVVVGRHGQSCSRSVVDAKENEGCLAARSREGKKPKKGGSTRLGRRNVV